MNAVIGFVACIVVCVILGVPAFWLADTFAWSYGMQLFAGLVVGALGCVTFWTVYLRLDA